MRGVLPLSVPLVHLFPGHYLADVLADEGARGKGVQAAQAPSLAGGRPEYLSRWITGVEVMDYGVICGLWSCYGS